MIIVNSGNYIFLIILTYLQIFFYNNSMEILKKNFSIPSIGILIVVLSVLSSPLYLYAETRPLYIGASISLQGKYAMPSWMMEKGYELWADQINRNGGLLGKKIKLVLYDNKSRLDLVKPLYRKMITQDHVDLVLSPYGSPLTLAASEVSEAHHFVMLACEASSEKIWKRGYKYIFGVYAPAGRYMIGFQNLMAKNGFRTLGVIFENSVFNTSIVAGVKKWTGLFGMDLIYTQSFNNGEKEFPCILNKVMAKNPEGLIFSAYPPDSYKFIKLMKKKNYRPRALAFTIVPVFQDFHKKVGAFADGIFGSSQWEPDARLPFPGTAEFIHNFKKFTGKMPDYHACSAFSACQILEKAAKQIKSLDQDKIRNFIIALDTVTVMGRFKVDHTGLQIGHNPMIIQWQHGKKEIVYPESMETSPADFKACEK